MHELQGRSPCQSYLPEQPREKAHSKNTKVPRYNQTDLSENKQKTHSDRPQIKHRMGHSQVLHILVKTVIIIIIIIIQISTAQLQRHWARVNDLPRVATRQCGGRESNPRPVDCKSNALTTTLLRHTVQTSWMVAQDYEWKKCNFLDHPKFVNRFLTRRKITSNRPQKWISQRNQSNVIHV